MRNEVVQGEDFSELIIPKALAIPYVREKMTKLKAVQSSQDRRPDHTVGMLSQLNKAGVEPSPLEQCVLKGLGV